jgi:hypothetical protein
MALHATDPWRFSQVSYAVVSMVRSVVIAVALVVFLGACGDKQLKELTAIKDEVCACKTPACGEAAMKKVPQREIESSHRMQSVANQMLDCMAKLYERQRPATDPDAEAPAEATSPGSAAPASPGTP